MLMRYIEAAMARAKYKIIEDDGAYFGRIPGFQGVWANAASLEACRNELRDVLESWILVSLDHHLPLPAVKGIRLEVRAVA